jgi:hypothetical protein
MIIIQLHSFSDSGNSSLNKRKISSEKSRTSHPLLTTGKRNSVLRSLTKCKLGTQVALNT